MVWYSVILSALLFLWELLKKWLFVYVAPFVAPFTGKGIDALWIIIPVWLSWFFAEWFQEKKKTSFGNAISNGVVPLWAGIDWARNTTLNYHGFTTLVFQKYFLAFLAIFYGCIIIYFGIKGKSFIPFVGRIREVTYFLVMFTPIVYDLIPLDLKTLLAIVLYFPIFYFAIEGIDHLFPDPSIMALDEGGDSSSSKTDPFSSSAFGSTSTSTPDFGSSSIPSTPTSKPEKNEFGDFKF